MTSEDHNYTKKFSSEKTIQFCSHFEHHLERYWNGYFPASPVQIEYFHCNELSNNVQRNVFVIASTTMLAK